MRLRPVRHSDLKKLPDTVVKTLCRSGVVPVVDQFWDLWGHQHSILFLVGSYGSGKSFFAVDDMINRCMNDSYFRCYYGRKVFDTNRKSVYPTITEQIESYEIPGFKYSKSDNSSMIITYENGNKFIPFGADKIDNLKSIKEPSHFLMEELDQFTADDFGMCVSRLGRTNKAKTQIIGMCNTDKIYEDHWLYPIIFGDNPINATIHWSNYRQNTMLPSIEDYETNLRIRAMGDEDMYNAIANGTPGVRNRQNAWIYVDYRNSIVDHKIEQIPGTTVYLSFDFNNEPMTCTAWQFSSGNHPMTGDGHYIHAIAEFETSMANSDEEIIQLLCKKIKAAFPYNPLRVTGDSNGHVRLKGVSGNKSIYFLIAKYLGISEKLLDVPKSNLTHTTSRALCNTVMYNHKNLRISKINTPKMYNDIQRAKANPDKQDEIIKDRATNKMDYFDTFRYIFATYFPYFFR